MLGEAGLQVLTKRRHFCNRLTTVLWRALKRCRITNEHIFSEMMVLFVFRECVAIFFEASQ